MWGKGKHEAARAWCKIGGKERGEWGATLPTPHHEGLEGRHYDPEVIRGGRELSGVGVIQNAAHLRGCIIGWR